MRARLAATVGCLLLAGAAVHASSVTVALKCRSGDSCELRGGALLLQSAMSASLSRRVPVTDGTVTLSEQAGSAWDVTLEANGCWALPQRVVFPAADGRSSLALAVWRTGMLQGRVTFPDPQPGAPIPVKLMVSSRPEPRTPAEIPRGTTFDCRTEKDGQWKCAVPATLLDIAVRVEGYAPFHKWDVRAPIGGTIDLGTSKLQKGASLVAWLDSDFARRVSVPVRAVVRHEAAPAVSMTAMRLALPVAEGVFTRKGVVQLAPIAPGRYLLEVQAKGYAPVVIPAQLYAGRETTPRQSIELSPALSVRLRIEPALGPGGIPWRVELWRRTNSGSGSQDAGNGMASRDGVFEAADQVEGSLRIFLKDSKGNIQASRDIAIIPGTPEYMVRVNVNAITGTVTMGDTPVAGANLLFGGSGGAEKIRALTDGDGHFTATLPRPGTWIVDVNAPKEAVAATAEVTIDKDDVEISLPSTEISGWVRDADGKRVPAARVDLYSAGRPMQRLTDADGTFRFRGVKDGSVQLRATDPRTHDYSKETAVTVPADGKVENVELDLESVRVFKGVLRCGGDVVVGALIHGFAFLDGGSAPQEQATTDLQGAFSFEIPARAPEVVVIASAPGRTLESFSVFTSQDPVVLDLAPRGGTLKLRWPPGGIPLRFELNGHFLPSTDVFPWARGQGARIEDGAAEIPNVAPGKYRFCSVNRCAEGLLGVGARLDLDATR